MSDPIDKLEEAMKLVVKRIHPEKFHNEAQVRQSAIVPILRKLNWDDTDADECRLEYAPPNSPGRVDLALFGANGKPLVFIEVKRELRRERASQAGEEQLFQYAYGQGVPLLILTDGNVWDFYLSMEEGRPAERCFYGAVLASDKTAEHAENFTLFLDRERVCSGEARIAAKQQLNDYKTKVKTRQTIPTVWRALLGGPDPDLRGVLATAVEHACGTAPEQDDLDKFLETQLRPVHQHAPGLAYQPAPSPPLPLPRVTTFEAGEVVDKKIVGYILDGQKCHIGSGTRTLAAIVKELGRRDLSFMDRLSEKTATHARRLVARDYRDLYDNPSLRERARQFATDLENGWWIGNNYNKTQVYKHIRDACKVAGIAFGSQLTLVYRGD